ncbi:MAG: glycogen synthase GlgA [Thermodesulfovibrionales bacterium]
MNILIASPEAVPYAKTGGLADVAGALLKEYRRSCRRASLIMPLYDVVRKTAPLVPTGRRITVPINNVVVGADLYATDATDNPAAYFVECDQLYARPELYGTPDGDYHDNAVRFIFFSRAVLEACMVLGICPDVIHCNDWQTALIPLYLKTLYASRRQLKGTATIFTVHNLGYQGNFDPSALFYTGLGRAYFTPEQLEFYGRLNFMKAGLLHADILTTVSETYAREITSPEHGFGLDGVLRKRQADLYGVLNGLDAAEWDPSTDASIPATYGPSSMAGKARCRQALRKRCGFRDGGKPVFGVVSRLSHQKGLDLVAEALDDLVSDGVNVAVFGKGDEHYQNLLAAAAARHRGRAHVEIGFAEETARLIYAGSDFFLMPSRYEPCGLGQMIAMRYGTLPVARATGGLKDTISDVRHLEARGTGFLFADASASSLRAACQRAVCVYADPAKHARIIGEAMRTDFSWRATAERYLSLCRAAIRRKTG